METFTSTTQGNECLECKPEAEVTQDLATAQLDQTGVEQTNLLESPSSARLLLVLPLLTLILCTIAANGIVMACVRIDKKLRSTPMNTYVFSLAVADGLVGLYGMGQMAIYTIYEYWPLSDGACTAWIEADFTLSTVSLFHLCLIAYDRWQALTDPLQYNSPSRQKKTAKLIGCAWLLATVLWVPSVTAFRVVEEPVPNTCWFVPNKIFVFASVLTITYAPICIMMYFYINCLLRLRQRSASIHSRLTHAASSSERTQNSSTGPVKATGASNTELTMPAASTLNETMASIKSSNTIRHVPSTQPESRQHQQGITVTRAGKHRQQENVRGIRTLGVVMVTFLICWLPYCFFWPVTAFCDTCIPAEAFAYSYWSAYINSCINPCLYFVSNRDFRKAFRTLMRKLGCIK